jgi:hypothetical protein
MEKLKAIDISVVEKADDSGLFENPHDAGVVTSESPLEDYSTLQLVSMLSGLWVCCSSHSTSWIATAHNWG